MKIVILGLITVAFTNVAIAAPSDKGGKDDMILEQMKDLRHKLQQQQHVIKELKEEQLQLKEEQVRRDEDQQYKMEELKEKQERSVEEVTKIQRTRRSENETVEHLKELVLAEIKPMIEGLSECAIGHYTFYGDAIDTIETIPFGRNFTRTPKVVTTINGFWRHGDSGWYAYTNANSITATKFDLECRISLVTMNWIGVTWIACA